MNEKPYRRNVGIIIIDKAGRLLAFERADNPGSWQLPQGGVDDGEGDEEAMWRELKEEIGSDELELLEATKGVYRYDFPDWLDDIPFGGIYCGQEQRYFVLRFKPGAGDAGPNLAEADGELRDFRWMTPAELLEQIIPFKKDVYRRVFKELGRWFQTGDD